MSFSPATGVKWGLFALKPTKGFAVVARMGDATEGQNSLQNRRKEHEHEQAEGGFLPDGQPPGGGGRKFGDRGRLCHTAWPAYRELDAREERDARPS